MRKLSPDVLGTLGGTPMALLTRCVPDGCAEIAVKMEQLNLGGSIKTRTALGMIEAAERDGRLSADSILVEPTSGNQGIAVAQVAAIKGYRARVVMPETMSTERRHLIEGYGAEVVLSPAGKDVAETFEHCIAEVARMAEKDPRVVVLGQFENPANPEIHYRMTGPEIWEQCEGRVDAFAAGVGTGGTITGVGRYLRERNPDVLLVAVEPAEAPVISGGTGPVGQHGQQGIGDGFVPANCDLDYVDECVVVSDSDAMATTHRLMREEGLAVGISSGSNVWAAMEVGQRLGAGKRVVTVLPDTAERYFSTELFSAKQKKANA